MEIEKSGDGGRRGRPRDQQSRVRVLAATLELLTEGQSLQSVGGTNGPSIEAIARRAGVGRPLIYRWWPDRAAVVLEAVLDATAAAAPYGDSGNAYEDLRQQMRDYAALLAGPLGAAYKSLFADAQRSERAAADLRERLMEPRREATRALLGRAIRERRLVDGLDLDALVDQLYAPVIYRLLLGHAPLTPAFTDDLVRHLFHGVRPDADPARTPDTPTTTTTTTT